MASYTISSSTAIPKEIINQPFFGIQPGALDKPKKGFECSSSLSSSGEDGLDVRSSISSTVPKEEGGIDGHDMPQLPHYHGLSLCCYAPL